MKERDLQTQCTRTFYSCVKEPYVTAKEPYIATKELYMRSSFEITSSHVIHPRVFIKCAGASRYRSQAFFTHLRV